MGDPWRSGHDPIQRWLRILTVVVLLGVFVYLAVDPDRGFDAEPTIALALGAILLLLGYEGVIRLPMFNGRNVPRPPPKDGPDDPA